MSAIYSINFATQANQNPLSDSGKWTSSTLQILSGVCQGTVAGAGTLNGIASLTGPTFPFDQYAQFKIAGLVGGGIDQPQIRMYLRQPSNLSFVNGAFRFFLRSDGFWSLVENISGTGTSVASGNTTFQVGDVFTVVCIGTAINVYQNNNLLTSYTDTVIGNTNTTIALEFANLSSNAADVATVSSFTAGTGNPLYYSEPDCRVSPFGPNNSRTVQGTSIFDVTKADSRAAGAPVDSRVSKPVDSRVPSITPGNSRTPGTFGPNN